MQLKLAVLALMGVNAAVEGSALRGRFHGHALLETRQGFGGGGAGGNGGKGGQGNGGGAAAAAAAAKAASSQGSTSGNNNNNGGNTNTNNGNTNAAAASGGGSGSLTLDTKAVQTGSQQDGSKGASAGQAKSITDKSNFINFCSGKTLTNGIQVQGGSCNGIVMGEMPASSKMAATIITSPVPGKEPAANKDFDVAVQIQNMQLGTFTNPDSTYYAAPQQLSSSGTVIGHTHITIQDLGNSLTPSTPPDASKFAFFKGINDAGNGQGKLTTTVTGGLPAGNYRVCTMAGSSNHQPVLMPIAQRGAQDDCVRITISNGGGNANNANANANANNANANANANAGNAAKGTAKGTSAPISGSTGQTSNTNTGAQSSASQAPQANSNPNKANPGASSSPSSASSSQGSPGTNGQNQAGQDSNKGSQAKPAISSATDASKGGAADASPSGSPPSSSAGNGNSGSSSSSSSSSSSKSIGGIKAPAVTDSGDSTRPFSVNGNTFVNQAAAIQRACAIQNNQCADAVNSGKVSGSTVGDCNTQEATCNQQGGA